MKKQQSWGGKRENSGRKPVDPHASNIALNVRVTAEQKAMVQEMGGSEWVRQLIQREILLRKPH